MEFQHVNVKLMLGKPGKPGEPDHLDLGQLIPIFHSWLRDQQPGDLLLDVADYRHVPAGPGVLIIGHEGNFSVDNSDNRLGVRYNRKAALAGSNQDRLRQAARAAITACSRLEGEPQLEGRLRFNGWEVQIFINDRLLATNSAATREALEPEFQAFARQLFRGSAYSLSYGTDAEAGDPRRLFSVKLESYRPFSVADLLANLNS